MSYHSAKDNCAKAFLLMRTLSNIILEIIVKSPQKHLYKHNDWALAEPGQGFWHQTSRCSLELGQVFNDSLLLKQLGHHCHHHLKELVEEREQLL